MIQRKQLSQKKLQNTFVNNQQPCFQLDTGAYCCVTSQKLKQMQPLPSPAQSWSTPEGFKTYITKKAISPC